MGAWTTTQSGSWSVKSSLPTSPWYDVGAQSALSAVPIDNDGPITIAAAHNVEFDVTQAAFPNGMAGVVITGAGVTPGMLYSTISAGTWHLKIKTGTTLAGTATAVKGRLLANANGVWGGTGQLPLASKFTIELMTTGYINAANLDITLLCKEPANPTINLSADEAIGQTELSVATSVAGDTWAAGDTVSICDLQGAQEHETRVIAAGGIAAGAITVTAGLTAAKVAGTYPAVMILCTRNIKIIGGSGASQIAISGLVGGTVNAWMYCATAAQGYALSSCSNFTISGGYIGVGPTSGWATGWSIGLNSCYGFTWSGGTSSGNAFGLNYCYGFTWSGGTSSGNTFWLNSCYGFTWSGGTSSGNTQGLSACRGFTWSGGTSSGNAFGLNICYGFRISGATLNNTTEMYRVGEGELFNCSLAGTENSQYNTTTVPIWNYIASYDHDQSAGAYKSWSMGGITLSKTTLPPGGFVTYYTLTCESATYHGFYQKRTLLCPGDKITVTGFVRFTDDHTGYAPRVQIIDVAKDPLEATTNVALAEQILSLSTTGWQSITLTYTNATTLPMPIRIRGLAKRATGDVDFALVSDVDTPADQTTDASYTASQAKSGDMVGNAYAPSTRVSPSGGVAVAVLVSARAVLTATNRSVREVYLLAGKSNTSSTYVNINAVASAGFEVPRAVGTVGNAGKCLRIPIASLTCLNFYGQTGDTVQVLYRD